MLAHPAHFFALGCGSGLAPKAPGTFGTLFAWASFMLFRSYFGDFQLLFLFTAAYLGGTWFIDVTGRALGDPDHGSIVWDEIVPFWLVLLLTPDNWFWQATAFALFRFFDAVKPGPVRWADNAFHGSGWRGGFGILLDDFVAASCTLLVIAEWHAW